MTNVYATEYGFAAAHDVPIPTAESTSLTGRTITRRMRAKGFSGNHANDSVTPGTPTAAASLHTASI
jgi:hypothetical protein